NETTKPTVMEFDSRESTTPSFRPTLSITYTTTSADLRVAVNHTGNFSQGNTSDHYSVTVSNSGIAPTIGAVVVTDTLPAGLTPIGNAGVINDWTVTTSGQTVIAMRSDPLANGASYPALTLTVAVSNTAPASVTNTATVAGGETNLTNDTGSDPTT